MTNKEKNLNNEKLHTTGVKKLSDKELDTVSGGKKVWIEPIKPQENQ